MNEVLICKGIDQKKTFVAGEDPEVLMKYAANKVFKKPASCLDMALGYVVGDDLYLEDPQKKNQKTVWVVYSKVRKKA